MNHSARILCYNSLVREGGSSCPFERYLAARSYIVSGEHKEALRLIESLEPVLQRILKANLCAFSLNNLQSSLDDLSNISKEQKNDLPVWILGDLYLNQCFLAMNLAQYTLALKYSQLAMNIFRKQNFPGFESVAVFNAWVCANHGEHLSLLERYRKRLQELTTSTPDSITIFLHHKRLEAYYAMDSEEFEQALELFLELIAPSEEQKRKRDIESALSFISFLCIKVQRWDLYETMIVPFMQNSQYFAERFRVFHEIGSWSAPQVRNIEEITILIRDLDPVGRLLGLYLIQEHLLRIKSWDLLWKSYLLFTNLTQKLGQSLSLLDSRRYGALALFHLGMHEDASKIIHSYEIDSRERGKGIGQIEKIRASLGNLFTENATSIDLIFDQGKMEIRTTLGRLSLKNKALSQKMLSILQKNQDHGLSMSEIFQEIYGGTFHPIHHSSRINSLVARTRDLLKPLLGIDPILVTDGKICLHRRVHVRAPEETVSDEPGKRKHKILQIFNEDSQRQWCIQDIQPYFSCSHKTLQNQLNDLIQQNVLIKTGEKRGTRYSLVQNVKLGKEKTS